MDSDEIRKVASLARLTLSDDEVPDYRRQLTEILGYIDVLSEVDVSDTEPMPHAVELQNVFRQDVTTDGLTRESALSNAPKTDGRYFLVPQILEQKDS